MSRKITRKVVVDERERERERERLTFLMKKIKTVKSLPAYHSIGSQNSISSLSCHEIFGLAPDLLTLPSAEEAEK